MPAHPYRWVVLAGTWLSYFSFSLIATSMAPLIEPITRDLHLSYGEMGVILAAWPLVYIGASLPLGTLLDRIGPRRAFLLAAAVMAASAAARAAAIGPVTMFLAVALFGLGGPLVSIGAPKQISAWFVGRERGFAMGVYISGSAIGTVVALTATDGVLMPALGGDWRTVLGIYGGFVLLSGLAWFALSAHSAGPTLEPTLSAGAAPIDLMTIRGLVRRPTIRILVLMSIGTFFFNHAFNNWLPEILKAGGMDAARAGYWASLPTVVGVLAALVIPPLALPARRFAILMGLFATAAAASLLVHASGGPELAVGLILLGIVRGSVVTLLMLILIETPEVGTDRAGAAGGMFFTAAETGAVAGPIMIGTAYDLTGGFAAPLYLLTAVSALLAMLGLLLRRHLNYTKAR